jgi:hypothetical protein
MIIGLIGNERVGKDTVGNYLKCNYNFKCMSFSEPIKKISNELFSWSDEKCNDSKDIIDIETGIKPRDFYKWLGNNVMKEKFDNDFNHFIPSNSIWSYSLYKKICNILLEDKDCNIVITDFRFNNEISMFLDKFKDIQFIIIKKNELHINDINNNWEYEITDIINHPKMIHKYNNKHLHVLNNNNSLHVLYNNIDKLMKETNINITYNNIDNCKYLSHC